MKELILYTLRKIALVCVAFSFYDHLRSYVRREWRYARTIFDAAGAIMVGRLVRTLTLWCAKYGVGTKGTASLSGYATLAHTTKPVGYPDRLISTAETSSISSICETLVTTAVTTRIAVIITPLAYYST